jgi:hypothetical protein
MRGIPEATPIRLSTEERAELEGLARSTKTEYRLRQRARIVLLAADGTVGESPCVSKLNHVSVGHGVSLLQWRSGGVEHPHDTPPCPFMPSPTSAHSSVYFGRAQTILQEKEKGSNATPSKIVACCTKRKPLKLKSDEPEPPVK